jgi:hypothetical protein
MQMSLCRKEQSTSPNRVLSSVAFGLALLISLSGCKKEETKQVSQPPAPPPAAQVPPPTPAASTPSPAASPAPSTAAAPAPTTSAAAETSTSPSPSAPSSQPTASSPTSSAQPAPSAAGKAIATSDGEKPGSRVEVQELKRVSGGTVMLRFAMINDADQQLNFGYDFGDSNTRDRFANIGGVHLIDAIGKKKYLVVRDSQDQCDCSRNLKDLAPKSRVNLWARFPAPPDGVEKVTVVVPHFSPMDDVSLSR